METNGAGNPSAPYICSRDPPSRSSVSKLTVPMGAELRARSSTCLGLGWPRPVAPAFKGDSERNPVSRPARAHLCRVSAERVAKRKLGNWGSNCAGYTSRKPGSSGKRGGPEPAGRIAQGTRAPILARCPQGWLGPVSIRGATTGNRPPEHWRWRAGPASKRRPTWIIRTRT